MDDFTIRHAEPFDYQPIVSVLNDWWDGRIMSDMLPKLFFVHFRETSFVAESGVNIVGFLIGFLSQTFPDQAYIHFAGVHPNYRRRGLACNLYGHFSELLKNMAAGLFVALPHRLIKFLSFFTFGWVLALNQGRESLRVFHLLRTMMGTVATGYCSLNFSAHDKSIQTDAGCRPAVEPGR